MGDKGYSIFIDAVFSLFITLTIFTAVVGLKYTGSSPSDISFTRLHYFSEDVFDVLNKKGVLDDIGEFWAAADGNRSSPDFINATDISRQYLDELIPESIGYSLTIDGEEIVNNTRGKDPESAMVKTHATRLLVGYGKGLPTRGYVARAFLTNIKEKETSTYLYFGGYIGQGNITSYVRDIPFDATVSQACFELNTPSSFDAYVNDNNVGTFTPSGSGMEATIKGPAGCINGAFLGLFSSGDNKIDLMFSTNNVTREYIGGGDLRVTYNTSLMDTDVTEKVGRYYFPGVNGLINIYDSMYIPGSLDNLSAYLHYKSNYSTFLNVGEIMIFNSSSNESDQELSISDAELQASGLVYQDLSKKTIPVRWGTREFALVAGGGAADIVFLIDSTGSMSDEISDVYSIIQDFTELLGASSIDFRLALVEYKDYPQWIVVAGVISHSLSILSHQTLSLWTLMRIGILDHS